MPDYNDFNAPGAGYQGYDMGYAPGQSPEELAAIKAQQEYTAKHAMSRDDFLKKYGETFVADDKGGNAASEVAGQNVGEYYDRWLDPKRTLVSPTPWNEDYSHLNAPQSNIWNEAQAGIPYKYRDQNPNFDAWDNVNPHPESQDLGGVGEFWRQIGRPAATAAAMYFGVNALGGALGSTGAAGSTAGGGSVGAAADFGAGTYAAGAPAELATTAGAMTAEQAAAFKASVDAASLGTEAALSPLAAQTITGSTVVPNVVAGTEAVGAGSALTAAQEAAMVKSLTAAGHTGANPSLWSKALTYATANPMKAAAGALSLLNAAGGPQSQPQAQGTGPLTQYTPQQTVQPYDWQKIQFAANRAGQSLSEYVSQNQRYLNAGIYP